MRNTGILDNIILRGFSLSSSKSVELNNDTEQQDIGLQQLTLVMAGHALALLVTLGILSMEVFSIYVQKENKILVLY